MRILLVEDEESLQKLLKLNLEAEGFEVIVASNGMEAVQTFQAQSFHLIILDIMLPELDGIEVCRRIRLEDMHIPILFLTARDAAEDRIKGLKVGGDDYLPKPFMLEELLLRVNNLMKRSHSSTESELTTYTFGPNSVNFETHEAVGVNGSFQLTKIEIRLLKMLVDRENEVVSRKEMLKTVWGYDVLPSTRTVDNFIMSFRKQFEQDSRNPQYFHAVRGIGYRFIGNQK